MTQQTATRREVIQQFLREINEAVQITAAKTTNVRDLIPATTEVAEAVLARYRRLHGDLFLPHYKVKVKNTCFCGECRNQCILYMNEPMMVSFIKAALS